jgi:hypothetical protein
MSATRATNAVAVRSPTPGTVYRSCTSGMWAASVASCRSAVRMFASSPGISLHATASVG